MQKLENMKASTVNDFVEKYHGECVDLAEGVLIDNMVYSFSFGTMFCFENALNDWSSAYIVLFYNRDRERGISKAWKRFEALKARA